MIAETDSAAYSTEADLGPPVQVTAHNRSVRRLGHWTHARRFNVAAGRGSVVLDLRSPGIEPGEVEVHIDADHSMVKLLVPEDATVDHHLLRRHGRCGFVDWGGSGVEGGRVVRVTGELRRSELRVNRGGIAIVSAVFTGEFLADLRRAARENRVGSRKDIQQAYSEGRWTTVDDPGRQV